MAAIFMNFPHSHSLFHTNYDKMTAIPNICTGQNTILTDVPVLFFFLKTVVIAVDLWCTSMKDVSP